MQPSIGELLDAETAVRRVRWFAAPLVLVQFALFRVPESYPGPLPFPRWPVALLLVATLVGTNLVSIRATRAPSLPRLRRLTVVMTVLDALLALAVAVLFGFDETSRLWPLLLFPIMEGAFRFGLRGAISVWAGVSAGYAIEQVLRLPSREDPATWIGSIPWGVGILGAIAAGTGVLATRLADERRRAEAEAQRLRELAVVSRGISGERTEARVATQIARAARSLVGRGPAELLWRRDGDWQAADGERIRTLGPDPDLDATAAAMSQGETMPVAVTHPAHVPGHSGLQTLIPVSTDPASPALLVVDIATEDGGIRALLDLLAAQAEVTLTNARRAEAEQATIDELRRLDELKNDFMSLLTHELRGPMTAVAGYAGLLRERWQRFDTATREQFLAQIEHNINRMSQLTRDVLETARAERSDLPIHTADVPLDDVVADAVATHVTPSTDHVAVITIDPDACEVRADIDRMLQVVDNLVGNAVKYSPDGGEIRVSTRRTDGWIDLTVSDDGLGMTADGIEHVFDKFTRLSTGRDLPGSGLGLYLADTLVAAMGGTITVRSVPGQGSDFVVRLPATGAITTAENPVGTGQSAGQTPDQASGQAMEQASEPTDAARGQR